MLGQDLRIRVTENLLAVFGCSSIYVEGSDVLLVLRLCSSFHLRYISQSPKLVSVKYLLHSLQWLVLFPPFESCTQLGFCQVEVASVCSKELLEDEEGGVRCRCSFLSSARDLNCNADSYRFIRTLLCRLQAPHHTSHCSRRMQECPRSLPKRVRTVEVGESLEDYSSRCSRHQFAFPALHCPRPHWIG
jgi:hypothetical protein